MSMPSTRSATVLGSLRKIYGKDGIPRSLRLHIIGADYREGNTILETQTVFQDLFSRLGEDNVSEVEMLFVGPNVAAGLHGVWHTFPHSEWRSGDQGMGKSCGSPDTYSPTVTIHFQVGLYHFLPELPTPHVVFCFNAGLWGYDDWVPTIEKLLISSNECMYIVITSYCAEEAEDDMDMIERVVKQMNLRAEGRDRDERGSLCAQWLWEPECNPHRSLVQRQSACAEKGRILFENHSWQAFHGIVCNAIDET
ncbi:unnamed protein product [Choristocarpus tenellus]